MLVSILENKLKKSQVDLQESKERIASLETENALLYLKLAKYEGQLNTLREEHHIRKKSKERRENSLMVVKEKLKEVNNLRGSLLKEFRELMKFQCSVFTLVKRLEMKLSSTLNQWKNETNVQSVLHMNLSEKEIALNEALKQMYKERSRRKILHNSLMEIRGNICVYCRVRPILPIDFDDSIRQPRNPSNNSVDKIVDVADDESILFQQAFSNNKPRIFEYDKVFSCNDKQQEVFDEISPLVTSLLDGYNVCIMAYGQTGSGKTHTMLGDWSNNVAQSKGIIPRTSEELFKLIKEYKKTSEIFVQISVFEIYNNEIRDLLSTPENRNTKLSVFSSSDGSQEISALTTKVVENNEDMLKFIRVGMQRRQEGRTEIHSHSSRSHLIVQVNVTQTKTLPCPKLEEGSILSKGKVLRKSTSFPDISSTSNPYQRMSNELNESFDSATQLSSLDSPVQTSCEVKSKLQLVDLAGSECVAMSGASGSTLLETSFINKSLSALADVLQSISENKSHIPYRNSKLTHLLQDTIGGNSKLAIMLCVSPTFKYRVESLHCLQFGSRARNVSRGTIAKRRFLKTRQQSLQGTL